MTTLYGIKNCDTVKKAKKWLQQHEVDFTFHDFRSDGLTAADIKTWLKTIDKDMLINRRSTTWKQLPENAKTALTETAGLGAMAIQVLLDSPTLIKRPVLQTGNTITVGFKTGDYQALFNIN